MKEHKTTSEAGRIISDTYDGLYSFAARGLPAPDTVMLSHEHVMVLKTSLDHLGMTLKMSDEKPTLAGLNVVEVIDLPGSPVVAISGHGITS